MTSEGTVGANNTGNSRERKKKAGGTEQEDKKFSARGNQNQPCR